MKFPGILAILLIYASPAAAQVRVTGHVPDGVSDENVQKVWRFVQSLTGIKSKEAPTIHFASFYVAPAPEADWDAEHPVHYEVPAPGADNRAWQERVAGWHRRHPDAPDPLPRSLMGWFFEDTDVLQISPIAFNRFPGTGQGYVVVAHELEHYLYDGILPPESQHCYFETHGHRLAAIDFLIASGIGGDSLRVPRVDNEPLSGCEAADR